MDKIRQSAISNQYAAIHINELYRPGIHVDSRRGRLSELMLIPDKYKGYSTTGYYFKPNNGLNEMRILFSFDPTNKTVKIVTDYSRPNLKRHEASYNLNDITDGLIENIFSESFGIL